MSGSALRFFVAIVFSGAVAFGCRLFGASLTISWLVFLALTGFGALAEIGLQVDKLADHLDEIDRKLEAMSVRLTS